MDITQDIHSLTDFKRDSSWMNSRMKEAEHPQIRAVNGNLSLVVMDTSVWQEMKDRVEFAQIVAGILKRLNQAREGERVGAAAFFESLRNSR